MIGIDIQTPGLATEVYVDDAIAAIGGGGGEASQNSFLVSGGQVAWQSAYIFLVSAATYYIGGVLYSSPQTTITLTAAAALDRIDTIAVDNTGTVLKVTGTAAATPSEPDIDPGTQLKLAIVSVPALSVAPSGAANVLLYADNVGSPTEWNWTASGASIVVGSTNNPRTGTKSIEGTTVVAGVYAQGAIGSGTLNPNSYDTLNIYIRSKAQWNNNRGLQVSLRTANVLQGVTVNINRSGTFGYDSSVTASYQQVAIPTSAFAIPVGQTITQVRIADFGGSIGFYLDDIVFQTNALTQTPVGITQAQADARYAPIATTVVGPSSAVNNDVAVFDQTTGKLIKDGGSTIAQIIAAGAAAAPQGDVVGPASAVTSRVAIFNGVSGKLIADGGSTVAAIVAAGAAAAPQGDVVGPASATTNRIATFNGATGKLIQDSGVLISALGTGDVVGPAASVASEIALFDLTTGKLLKRATQTGFLKGTSGVLSAVTLKGAITFVVDGGGSAITTGIKGDLQIPFDCTIVAARLLADQSGSIVVNVWKDTYANFPPDVTDKITASAPPTITTATKSQDTTLTGWTTAITAGDILRFNVDSITTVTRVTLVLEVNRTN